MQRSKSSIETEQDFQDCSSKPFRLGGRFDQRCHDGAMVSDMDRLAHLFTKANWSLT